MIIKIVITMITLLVTIIIENIMTISIEVIMRTAMISITAIMKMPIKATRWQWPQY